MDRSIPVYNRPVIQKIQRINQTRHLERLRNIKTGHSNRTMQVSSNYHTLSNKKSAISQQRKRTQIQKQNALLFTKMMRIMKRDDPLNQPQRGQVTRMNNKIIFDNSRIMEENKNLFDRLESQKPTISNKRLQQERLKNLNILKFIGKYPNSSLNRTKFDIGETPNRYSQSKRNTFHNKQLNLNQYSFDQQAYNEQFRTYQHEITKLRQKKLTNSEDRRKFMSQAVPRIHKRVDSQQNDQFGSEERETKDFNFTRYSKEKSKTVMRSTVKGRTSPISLNKQILLFQKKMRIDKNLAEVEIVRTDGLFKIHVVFDFPFKGQQHYSQQIPQDEGKQFFSQQKFDYHRICKMLTIEDGHLVINVELEGIDSREQKSGKKRYSLDDAEKNERMLVKRESQITGQNCALYLEALEEELA